MTRSVDIVGWADVTNVGIRQWLHVHGGKVEVRDEVSLCESKVVVYALLRVLLCIDAGRMDGSP